MKWMSAVKAAGRKDFAFASDHFGAGPDDDGHAGLDVRIAGLPDGVNVAILDADVGFDDAPMVEDQRVGDNGVDRALLLVICDCPMPSRMTLPPPNFTSSP